MKQKGKGIRNPKIKLTLTPQQEKDVEKGLVSNASSDLDDLLRFQLAKARKDGRGDASEMQVLMQACAGPLELFEGLGKTSNVYVAVLGPPHSKRWILGIWNDKKDFDAKRPPKQEV